MRAWIEYIPFRFVASLFALLPEAAVRKLGMWAAGVASRMRKGSHALLASHARRACGPRATDSEILEVVDGMYRSYGRYWAETLWFRPRRRGAIAARVERLNFDAVYSVQATGRGIVFALPHIGNWEVAGLIAEDIGIDLMAVAEHLPNQKLTDWFLAIRAKFGIDIVLTSDPNRRSKMVHHLQQGGALALVADRDISGRGVPVEFFGEETTLPAGPALLAELTDSALIPVAVYFKDGAGHILEVGDPIIIPEAETRELRVNLAAQQVAERFEDMIRKAPAQWHLFQPNWPSDAEHDHRARP